MKRLSVRNYLGIKLFAFMVAIFVLFMPFRVFAADEDPSATGAEVTTEATTEETPTETPTETPAADDTGSGTNPASSGGMSEIDFQQMVDIPDPTLDQGTAAFFDTVGGKILGFLLKLLSVGMLLTCVADLVFIAVPFTQGMFLAAERSGFPIISNEAHQAAGVPKEMPMNRQGRGGHAGGYGGMGGGMAGGYGGMGGGYGGGMGMGMQGQQGQQDMTGGGVKAYIRSSFVRLILVTAFAVFMLSGVYIHVGYAIGNGFTQAMSNI
jgi:hypothetical protein